jgi:hypothetical protein
MSTEEILHRRYNTMPLLFTAFTLTFVRDCASLRLASIWLCLGLALTSVLRSDRLTLKMCAVPGTQQLH